MFFSEQEELIISKFCTNLETIENSTIMLIWEEGRVEALFDTCFEDMDDDTEEEYHSFVFVAKQIEGKPPVEISEDNLFLVSYKNFPEKIMLENKNII